MQEAAFLPRFFRQLATFCFDKSKWVLAFSFLCLGLLASQVPHIPVDMSAEAVLHEDDPIRVTYDNFKRDFGRDDLIIVSMPVKDGLNHRFFSTLLKLQNDIENKVPHINKVTSLINARVTYSEDDELIVEDLLEGFPDKKIDSQSITKFVLNQENYIDRFISKDAKHTAILIEPNVYSEQSTRKNLEYLTDKESSEQVNALRDIVNQYSDSNVLMTGKPVLHHVINIHTLKDSATTGGTALLLALGFMVVFFRRLSGVLLPLTVILGSILGAVGAMGFMQSPFTLTISAVYPLMVAVGVADAVHVLAQFYRNYEQTGDKRKAILEAVSETGPAILMTSLTTAVGFLSFTVGDLASTANLGIYAALAVMLAWYFTVAVIPAFIAVFPIKQHSKNKGLNKSIEALLLRSGNLASRFPRAISLIGITLIGVCIYGTQFLGFSYDPISRFPDSVKAKLDNYTIDSIYSGNASLEVIIDTQKPRGLLQGDMLNKLQQANKALSDTEIDNNQFAKAYSVLNIVKETNKALNNNQQNAYSIPDDAELVAQELLLFEMNNADDLRDVADSDLQRLRMTLKTHHSNGVQYAVLVDNIEKILNDIFQGEAVVTITGNSALMAGSVPKALKTMAKSYVVAGVLIVLMMMLMVRSVKIGLVSIVPNILPILLVLNVMVIMSWPLDMTTILVGAIAMGIVVDDTLHFLYNFKKHYSQQADARLAVRNTLTGVGPALFITTIIFSTGSGSNMLSSIENIFIFGFTMWLVTILALLADILIAPALLIWVFDKK